MKLMRAAGLAVVSVLTVVALQAAVAAYNPESTSPLAGDSRVFIEPRSTSVEEGETFSVTVMVENAQDMIGYEFEMSWDSSVVSVIDVTDAGSLLQEPTTSVSWIGDDGLNFLAAVVQQPPYTDGADGDFPLAEITLQAVGTGVSPLDLDGADVEWTDIALTQHEPAKEGGVDDGRVTVGLDFAAYLPLAARNYGP
jgi:hypothetical protein